MRVNYDDWNKITDRQKRLIEKIEKEMRVYFDWDEATKSTAAEFIRDNYDTYAVNKAYSYRGDY